MTLDKISEIKKLDYEIVWKSNAQMSDEFINDLRLFIDKTYIFAKKVKIHLEFRRKKPASALQEGIDDFIISLRKWFAVFMKRWLETSQPMGLYFHIHFIKMLEINTIKEIQLIKKNHDYKKLKKRYIYDIPEYTNIKNVCDIKGLNKLWENFRL